MSKYEKLCQLVKGGETEAVAEAVTVALADGETPQDILDKGLIAPLEDLGRRFQEGEVYVPELLIASEAMKRGVEILKPLMMNKDVKKKDKCLFCTVEGDVHDIGKNLVILFLESAGYEVIDLGTDVDVDDVIEALENDVDIRILGMSAMLTTTMYTMQDVIDAVEDAGLRNRVKIMAGGAPVNQDFADKIGADGYSANAPEAVALVKRLLAD